MWKQTYDARIPIMQKRAEEERLKQRVGETHKEGDAAKSRLAAMARATPADDPTANKEQAATSKKEDRTRRQQQREKKKEDERAGGHNGGGGKGRGRGKGAKDHSRGNKDIRDFAGGESKTAAAMKGAPGPKAPYTGGFKVLDPSAKPSPLPRDKVKAFPIRHTAESKAAAKKAEEERAAAAAAERKKEAEKKRREEKAERSEKKDARKNAGGARGGFDSASERMAWRVATKQKPVIPPSSPGGRGREREKSTVSMFRDTLPLSGSPLTTANRPGR